MLMLGESVVEECNARVAGVLGPLSQARNGDRDNNRDIVSRLLISPCCSYRPGAVPGSKTIQDMTSFIESVVEDAALAWLESIGYAVKHGPEIAPGELFAERGAYGQVILPTRLREALMRLNSTLPAEAIDDAFRKIIRLEGATLDTRNRTFHRLL